MINKLDQQETTTSINYYNNCYHSNTPNNKHQSVNHKIHSYQQYETCSHSLSGQHNKPINTHCVAYMFHTNKAYSMEREIWWNGRDGRIGGNSQIFVIRLQAD